LDVLNRGKLCDVVIIGRGGGSLEELWAFNEEPLVRAVAASAIPVISAVGHETDYTLCDFAADLRAATPTAAAQLVAPDQEELLGMLVSLREKLTALVSGKVDGEFRRLDRLTHSAALSSPIFFVRQNRQTLGYLVKSMRAALEQRIGGGDARLAACVKLLDSLSPLKVLSRGYTITMDENGRRILESCAIINPDDRLLTRFADGDIVSVAVERRENNAGQ
jgi:exodeoxyribonuclease VII large subunit